jgi:hypothetical protein
MARRASLSVYQSQRIARGRRQCPHTYRIRATCEANPREDGTRRPHICEGHRDCVNRISRAGHASTLQSWSLASLAVAVLLVPLIWLALHHATLTGVDEESSGYRYFYSLRILYGMHERPWLPQGQLVGLVDMAIQIALTAMGFSPKQLAPRIDIFTYAAAATPIVLMLPALFWALQPLSVLGRGIIVTTLIAVIFEARSMYGLWVVATPDYVPWCGAVSLVAVGWLLRLTHAPVSASVSSGLAIAVYAGLCAALKPSYVVFALPLFVLLMFRSRTLPRAIALGSSFLGVAGITALAVTWLYYLGDLSAAASYFVRLNDFVKSIGNSTPPLPWLRALLMHPFDAVSLSLILPVLLTCSLLLPRRQVTLGLLAGSLCSVYFAYQRFYPVTVVETNLYAYMAMVVWVVVVLKPWVSGFRSWPAVSAHRATMVTAVALMGFLIARAGLEIKMFTRLVLPSFVTATRGAARVAAFVNKTPGRTVFLIPDNYYRLRTVDTAIFKGGSDIGSSTWGDSPYVKHMFPKRWYYWGRTAAAAPPLDLHGFTKLVFVSIPLFGGDRAARKYLYEIFGVTTTGFDCSLHAVFADSDAVLCRRVASATDGPPPVPETPNGMRASLRSAHDVLVSWNGVGGTAEFEVQRSSSDAPYFVTIGHLQGASTELLDTHITGGVRYSWRVRACNQSGCSSFSAPVSFQAPGIH